MSKNINKDYELLSAYLDEEISAEQIQIIESKLAASAELRRKLEELKELKKLTNSSFKSVPESPYFETVLNQKIEENKKSRHNFRIFAPAYGLGILTIIIILLLKFDPKIMNNAFENRNTNLAGLYGSNLKPLLFAADLSNEDIFNFAFYKQLPLDNSNKQYLQLGTDESGEEYFEIKKNTSERRKNNLKKFALALGLNNLQKSQVDSIIKSYAEELQGQILVNDKNTLAVSQNLFDYNRALAAELLTFAAKANKSKLGKIMPAGLSFVNNKKTMVVLKEIKTNSNNSTHQFVFINEDTIFTQPYTVDKEKLKKEITIFKERNKNNANVFKNYSVNIKLDSNFAKVSTYKYFSDSLVVSSDSNSFIVKVPKIQVPTINIKVPKIDSLVIELDKARENFKEFSYSFPKNFPKFKGKFNFNFTDSTKDIESFFKQIEIDSIIKNNFKMLDSLNLNYRYNYKINGDSLKYLLKNMPKMFKKYRWFDRDEELKKLKKEMKELKKELKEMKKKLKYSKKKIKT